MPDSIYLAVDGDDVGHRLEYFMLANEVESLASFSARFRSAMDWLRNTIVNDVRGSVVFSGGDNLLACVPAETPLETIEDLRTDFYQRAEAALSVGLGGSPRQAYIALNFAKASGKDCTRCFEELPDG